MSANDRITVSEDRLRAVMAEFELRFLSRLDDRLERKADLVMLNETRKAQAATDVRVDEQGDDIESLRRWQSWIMGGLAVLGVGVGVLTAVVVAVLT